MDYCHLSTLVTFTAKRNGNKQPVFYFLTKINRLLTQSNDYAKMNKVKGVTKK